MSGGLPDERNADRNRFAMYGELRQKMRHNENAEDNSNNPRHDQQIPAAAILRNSVRNAPFARDEPYLDGDPRPITYRQYNAT